VRHMIEMKRRSPVLIGMLLAIPVGFFAGWWTQEFLDPRVGPDGPVSLGYALGLGPWRWLAFVVGYLIAGAIVVRRIADERSGSVTGFVWFVLLGQTLALTLANVDGALARPAASFVTTFGVIPLKVAFSLLTMVWVWVPGGVIWTVLARRLTVEGVAGDVVEASGAYAETNAAARRHQTADGVLPQDQHANLSRGRG
jgi:hypothetical protein